MNLSEQLNEGLQEINTGNLQKGADILNRLLSEAELEPKLRAIADFELGKICIQIGRVEDAKNLFNQAVFSNPFLTDAHFALSDILKNKLTKNSLISVILPTYNRAKELSQSIESLRKSTFSDIEIIVIAEPSKDGTHEYLRQQSTTRKDIISVINSEKLGYVKSVNIGCELARGDYICFYGDDAIAMPGWDIHARILLDSDSNIGCVTPIVINPNGTLQSAGESNPYHSIAYEWLGKRTFLDIEPARGLPPISALQLLNPREIDYGYFHIMKRECFNKVGKLDERYVHYFSDPDQGYRVQEAGYKVMSCPPSMFIHYELSKNNMDSMMEKATADQDTFVKRWKLYEPECKVI